MNAMVLNSLKSTLSTFEKVILEMRNGNYLMEEYKKGVKYVK